MKSPRIDTERLVLRALTSDDVSERYLSWLAPENAPFIAAAHRPQSIATLEAFVEAKRKDPAALLFGIFLRANDRHVGNLKYEPLDVSTGTAVMGILIGEVECRGKGIAEEAIRATSAWLSRTLSIRRVLLGVDRGNDAAIRAYQNMGFIRTQTVMIPETEQHFAMRLDLESFK